MHILSDMDMFKRLSDGVDMWRYGVARFSVRRITASMPPLCFCVG